MELLTVIAIIGVLAGLIFPVAAGAKRKARQAQCVSNMYEIFQALKQFQLDEHRYPDFIVGPVQWKQGTGSSATYNCTGSGTMLPLEETTGMIGGTDGGNGRVVALFPEYISSLATIRCPFTDQNGDGNKKYTTGSDPTDVIADPLFTYYQTKGITGPLRATGTNPSNPGNDAFSIYRYSSYDYQKPQYVLADEIHYATAWESDMNHPQITRQLKWRTPPETTVVTWCTHHRTGGNQTTPVQPSAKDPCLFLDGHVKQVPSTGMEPWTNGWTSPP